MLLIYEVKYLASILKEIIIILCSLVYFFIKLLNIDVKI